MPKTRDVNFVCRPKSAAQHIALYKGRARSRASVSASKGPVAQLNRVSDSGSEGSGFEPQRGHRAAAKLGGCFSFLLF